MRKTLVIGGVILAIIVLGVAAIYFIDKRGIDPSDPTKPLFKDVVGYSDGNYYYNCSKSLKARLQEVPSPLGGPKDFEYVPINLNEAKLFCHSTVVIENEGKIKVLQKPEVLEFISRYQYKEVTIKALEFKYIKDVDYIKKLLPEYKDREIGCIIVLQTPDSGMVFLEDEKLDTFEQMDYQTFKQHLSKVSPADQQLFYENLK